MLTPLDRLHNAYFLSLIRNSAFPPVKEQTHILEGFYITNLAISLKTALPISENIASGTDLNQHIAIAKSISEYIERISFREGKRKNNKLCQTNRSEGFSAYPYFLNKKFALDKVRKISLCESIERYCWPYFWSNVKTSFSCAPSNAGKFAYIKNLPGILSLFHIYPKIDSNFHLCISIARYNKSGIIIGACCSDSKDDSEWGSIHEIIKHYIAIKNIEKGFSSNCPYSMRLINLATNGFLLYKDRLKYNGKQPITLPLLELDGVVCNPFTDKYIVYRTRFEKQPEFITPNSNVGYL